MADRETPRLDDFTLLKVIGKGSYGKVMLVRHKDDPEETVYAMKMLRKENVIKRNQVEHTKTERNVLEAVSHPFIVTLHYAFQTPKKLYFVLEYCPGGELFFHLSRAGRFSEGRCRFYASEILLAIEYLHRTGLCGFSSKGFSFASNAVSGDAVKLCHVSKPASPFDSPGVIASACHFTQIGLGDKRQSIVDEVMGHLSLRQVRASCVGGCPALGWVAYAEHRLDPARGSI
ncbi:unnamed protein product [Prorocentrum cordatum]|uniref:Protein kinase domain-containing protein n=1 Tax=Prorocentrum cordatum TaxID=2364126 RepID=A0ABN9Y2Q4_9DINO|nr:unnamed protein product [Polarella glacialis]